MKKFRHEILFLFILSGIVGGLLLIRGYKWNGLDKEIQYYNKYIRLKPNFPDAYYGRGLAYCKKRDFDKAISDFSEAIHLNRAFVLAYEGRGVAHFRKEF